MSNVFVIPTDKSYKFLATSSLILFFVFYFIPDLMQIFVQDRVVSYNLKKLEIKMNYESLLYQTSGLLSQAEKQEISKEQLNSEIKKLEAQYNKGNFKHLVQYSDEIKKYKEINVLMQKHRACVLRVAGVVFFISLLVWINAERKEGRSI